MTVLSHWTNFKFYHNAIAKAGNRYIRRKNGRYKIIPNLIAIDVHKDDAQQLKDEGFGDFVRETIRNGTVGYKSLSP